ncbi:hypothetical protein [Cellvibrio fontiphilus]|uniref:Uncharacterized protein n=1 Tax=Cellvibrio fontiphilus TaxID=1815559 RepID=A0ABV7FDL6_9GAMM
MEAKVKASWQRALHPKTLKKNIITASIFSMAFEMLKDSIVEKIHSFYTNGLDENGFIISEEYKHKVLSLNKSPLYASLKWLQNIGAINEKDLERFEYIKKCRNTLAHEMLKFTAEELDFEVSEVFSEMVNLLRKIELWWFENLEMAIVPCCSISRQKKVPRIRKLLIRKTTTATMSLLPFFSDPNLQCPSMPMLLHQFMLDFHDKRVALHIT